MADGSTECPVGHYARRSLERGIGIYGIGKAAAGKDKGEYLPEAGLKRDACTGEVRSGKSISLMISDLPFDQTISSTVGGCNSTNVGVKCT